MLKGTSPISSAQVNEIFARNHGHEERDYYAARYVDPPMCADPHVGRTFYDLTANRNYGRSKRCAGCE